MATAMATATDPTASAARRRVAVACGFALVLCAAGGLAAWQAGWFGRPTDPRLVELRLFQDELVKKYPPEQGPKNVIEAAERAAAVGQFMIKVQALPAELRPEAMRGGAAVMMQAMNAKMNTYFALPREQRQAFLDGEIAQQELMRQAFAAGQSMMRMAGMGKTAGQGGPADGRPMGPGGGSIEDRNRMRKGIIDRTSPQQRSRFSEYTGSLERRRHERGLPPMPFGP